MSLSEAPLSASVQVTSDSVGADVGDGVGVGADVGDGVGELVGA
jgi:hypothetical protein